MGSPYSRLIRLHPHARQYPKSTPRYDWDAEEGGCIPYRFQGAHRKKRRGDERRAAQEKARFERERSARRYADVEEKKRAFRRQYDERRARLRGGVGGEGGEVGE